MPHVSKSVLNKKIETEIKKTFCMALSGLGQEEEMNEFLTSILSPTENLMLSKRLAIVLLLSEDVPSSKIAAILHVTRETVARVELLYQLKPEGYKTALKKINNQETIYKLKHALLKLAGYTVRAAGGRVKPEIF